MGRPKGSKNKHKPLVRRGIVRWLRLSTIEAGAMDAASLIQGREWTDWARRTLRAASGLSEQDPREKGSDPRIDTGLIIKD